MNTKEAYKKKIEADMELTQARLAEFQAHARKAGADAHLAYKKQAGELENMLDTTKVKLKELGEASDSAWEDMKEGVESAWSTLSAAMHDASTKFKS